MTMRLTDPFRDPGKARALLAALEAAVAATEATPERPLHVMEICGGHTHAIFRYGLDALVPPAIAFVHGPGCPVCVLPMSRVDDALAIAERPGVVFATFGDAVRVPGTRGSLLDAKARGADVRIVYSPLDALEIARRHPDREVVFFGLGFETTMPASALTLKEARRRGIANFSLFCNHILVPPPIRALLEDPHTRIDGFVGPGHVSMVIGTRPYRFVAETFGKPLVVSGFEPLDLLQSVLMVVRQIAEGRAAIENQYARVVPEDGNPVARAEIEEVFTPRASFDWRGLGEIDRSGVAIREAWAAFDAERRFGVGYGAGAGAGREAELAAGCRCGDVVKGAARPTDCPHFGTRCTPESPLGALMVSSEGACAAYHLYARPRPAGDRAAGAPAAAERPA